jgi:hypothetical protein
LALRSAANLLDQALIAHHFLSSSVQHLGDHWVVPLFRQARRLLLRQGDCQVAENAHGAHCAGLLRAHARRRADMHRARLLPYDVPHHGWDLWGGGHAVFTARETHATGVLGHA